MQYQNLFLKYNMFQLNKLGELCGLMPGDSNSPNSDQLSLVVDLTSGMGLEVQSDDEDEGMQFK